eukprot:3205_1
MLHKNAPDETCLGLADPKVTYLLSDVDNDTKTLLTESHVECMSHVDLWPHLIQKMNVFAICTTTDPKEMLYFGKNKTLWNTFLSMASKFMLNETQVKIGHIKNIICLSARITLIYKG